MHLLSLKPVAFLFALAGLALLFFVNITLLMGKPAPIELSFVQIFFFMFPIWTFTIYYLKQRKTLDETELAGMAFFQKIRYILGNPPTWAMVIVGGIYLYAMYSVFLFMGGAMMEPTLVNGLYQINNHGNITFFTESEYVDAHKLHIRAITGFFMAFFVVSAVALAPWPDEVSENL